LSKIVVVTAVGRDQPGIVAALTGAVYHAGGNLDDATMTRLHGVFSTMVSVQIGKDRTLDELRTNLDRVGETLGLIISAEEVDADHALEAPPDHLITVYGADKPGLVYGITTRLASLGVNITDMDTRVAGDSAEPVYVMILEVVAGDLDLASLLSQIRTELNVDIAVQSLDSEAL
jgi:glycine cleavage system transcriptional repressor